MGIFHLQGSVVGPEEHGDEEMMFIQGGEQLRQQMQRKAGIVAAVSSIEHICKLKPKFNMKD